MKKKYARGEAKKSAGGEWRNIQRGGGSETHIRGRTQDCIKLVSGVSRIPDKSLMVRQIKKASSAWSATLGDTS